jgi:hypothetical protein
VQVAVAKGFYNEYSDRNQCQSCSGPKRRVVPLGLQCGKSLSMVALLSSVGSLFETDAHLSNCVAPWSTKVCGLWSRPARSDRWRSASVLIGANQTASSQLKTWGAGKRCRKEPLDRDPRDQEKDLGTRGICIRHSCCNC